jgi:acylphosphatase
MKARANIIVSGMVQGIGYRFFVERIAARYGLAGWVRNLPDGRVEVEVEGDKGLIGDFIEELKLGPPGAYVSGAKVTWKEYQSEFDGFRIRFW